ncbi:uncharacterized protein VP01_7592g1, partial [Puccinia sorghi]
HRYQLQNIFFASITPGPSEPTVLQMNNVVSPLVEELVTSWHRGINIATSKYPQAHKFHVALILAVCDLPAIQKLIGYASHSATQFCSFCYLQESEISLLEYHLWKKRTFQGHRIESEAWKLVTTHAQCDNLFKSSGVRWSVLNNLPYCNPIDFVVVDPMYLLSGMLEWHARQVWCIDEVSLELKKKKVDVPKSLDPEDYFEEDVHNELRYTEENLVHNSIDLASLQDALMEIDDEIHGKDEMLNGTPVFTSEDLKLIHRVITQARIPSWLNRPSTIFGDASAGKVGSPQNELVDMWYHLAMLTELAVEYEVDESVIQNLPPHQNSTWLITSQNNFVPL